MKISIGLVLMLFCLNANAGWSKLGEVAEVMSHDGHHVIYTDISDAVCGNTGQFWWPADDADAKDMLSIALAALMSGKKVSVVYDPANLNCAHGAAAMVTHMRIVR